MKKIHCLHLPFCLITSVSCCKSPSPTNRKMETKKPSLGDFFRLADLIELGNKEETLSFIKERNITNESFGNLPGNCFSPLYSAAKYGHLDIAISFLDLGLNCQHPLETPPVNIAAAMGHLPVVKLLSERGFLIDGVDVKGNTPLLNAVETGHFEVVRYLVESGCNVNHINKSNQTALHMGCETPNLDVFQYILSNGFKDINAQDSHGNTILTTAFLKNCEPLINFLLEHGVDVRLKNDLNMAPIWLATCYDYPFELLQTLCRFGADPEVRGFHGVTPLMTAAGLGHLDQVRYFVSELNLDMNAVDAVGLDPLMSALRSNKWKVAVLLIKAGCEVKEAHVRMFHKQKEEFSEDFDAVGLTEELFQPRRLLDLCTFAIRKILGRSVSTTTLRLRLPSKLHNYLNLTHL